MLTRLVDWIELIGSGKDDAKATSEISSYRFNHTMLRVKDPVASLKFYKDVLGMHQLRKSEVKEAGFDLYFLSFPHHPAPTPENPGPSINPIPDAEGILELTHNYGSEDKSGQVYTNGNDTEFDGAQVKQGFGHIALTVDDIDAACARFESMGVQWKKRLTDGRMKTIAFVLDPDNCTFTP